MRRRFSGELALIAALLAGCDEPAPDARSDVLDARPSREWTVGAPVLSVGEAEGPPGSIFFRARNPVFVDSDSWLVSNAGHEFRLYGIDGELRRSFGSKGGGPGEFTGVSWHTYHRPTGEVVVLDQARTLMRLTLEGAEISRWIVEPRLNPNFRPGVLASGELVAMGPDDFSGGSDGADRFVRDTIPIRLYGGDGIQTLHEVGGLAGVGGGGTYRAIPFGPRPALAVAAGYIVVSEGSARSLLFLDPSGRRSRGVSFDEPPHVRTRAHLDAWIQQRRELFRTMGAPSSAVVFNEDHERFVPETLPGYWTLRIDDRDCVWAQRYRAPGTLDFTWDVIDPGGSYLAEVRVPENFALSDVVGSRMIGVETDDFGVERVVVLPIHGRVADQSCTPPFP